MIQIPFVAGLRSFLRQVPLFLVILALAACKDKSLNKDHEPGFTTGDAVEESQVELAYEANAQLGEGAFWDPVNQKFYWVDILGKQVNRFDPTTGTNERWETPSRVGTVVPASSHEVVVALEDGFYILDLQDSSFRQIADTEADKPGNRFNDGKCDPMGNLWVGSMHLEETQPEGALYKVEPSGKVTRMRDSVTISNGIVWSADQRTMYYIDTPTAVIRAYDFDPENATIANERVVVEVFPEMGFPDGMAIDSEDKLWVGLWNGNAVARFDPESGELLSTIPVPAHNVTACAFGGPGLDTLYITTARVDMTPEELQQYPKSGSVFKVVPGVTGVPSPLFGKNNE